jgi:hypothetical protein
MSNTPIPNIRQSAAPLDVICSHWIGKPGYGFVIKRGSEIIHASAHEFSHDAAAFRAGRAWIGANPNA